MSLSSFSIRRPIAMGCLIVGLALLGLNSWRKMGLELMPRSDIPFITISTIYPGAAPQEIETDVAKRIEDAVVSIDGLKHVTSSCFESACHTILEFNLGVDVDVAATDVREKLDLIRADFPEGVEDPRIVKFNINSKPIVVLALTGDAPLDELYDFADNALKDRLTVIRGVASVELIGGAKREVHVKLDRRKLAARALSAFQVVQALKNGVRTVPSGNIKDGQDEYSVKFDAGFDTLEGIGGLEVANATGQRCTISDVGRVVMTTGEVRRSSLVDGRPCVAVRVVKKAEANAVEVSATVRSALDSVRKELPGGMELLLVSDDGRFIEATNKSAWTDVTQGIILTALILFVFLHNLRSVFVIAITMPLTIVIGLFFMDFAGFTLNTSTLVAIGMSVGILVTNSIVVLEAILDRFARTGDARLASELGAKESFIAVFASAATNIVVLFPLAMMKTLIGVFIKDLALTMVIMTFVSLFISFTLTPLLCSLLLKPASRRPGSIMGRFERLWNAGFTRVTSMLRRVLEFNDRHRYAAVLVLLAVAAMLVHSVVLGSKVGNTFATLPDQGQAYVKFEFPVRYNLDMTVARIREAEKRMEGLPELKHMLTTVGKVEGVIGQTSEGVYLAQMLLRFSERDERSISINVLLDEIRRRLADFPGAIVTASIPDLVGGQGAEVEMEIAGPEIAVLDDLALRARTAAARIPGIKDPDTTVRPGKPEFKIYPRRDVLSDLGLPAVGLGMNLRANLEGLTAATYTRNARNYDIVVKLDEEPGRGQVEDFMVPVAGRPLLLASLATTEESSAPVLITRKDKRRISKFLSGLDKSLPLGTAVTEISRAVDAEVPMPAGYRYYFSGMYEIMSEANRGFVEALIISVVLVILTLAAILESLKQPVIILVTLPLAVIGVFWALLVTGAAMDFFVLMGCVMMVGIVVNDAILIVDQFNVHVREGIPRHKAMITATCESFRPVVMITLAAVLGMVPLAIGRGIGAELRNSVGIASIGGIGVSGLLTIIVVPIVYDLCTRKGRKDNGAPD